MMDFCTNCGHQNIKGNRICTECGTPLSKETPIVRQPGKPMPLKKKLAVGLAAFLIAILIGTYTWGTKVASAESAVSNFFEALQQKDAKALAKVVALTNREQITEEEGKAFIEMYGDLTPEEIQDIAAVEKKGKVAGVFDAHKIVLNPQKVSVPFSYEGLELKLNGKVVEGKQNAEGDYVFSNISPGLYQAELNYSGEFTEFSHPFELWVEQQFDSSYVQWVNEELSVGTVAISAADVIGANMDQAKVWIGKKEMPLDENGETAEIGPLPLDGSMEAKLVVQQPWGTAESESISIESGYIHIDSLTVKEDVKDKLGKRFLQFGEELVQASAARNASLLTTVTAEQYEELEEEIDYWIKYDTYYKGALTEVRYDKDSFYLDLEENTVTFDGAIVADYATYSDSETPEMETDEEYATMEFVYDSETSSWLLNSIDSYWGSGEYDSPATLEGSKTMHSPAGQPKPAADQSAASVIDEEALEDFMYTYNEKSVEALNSGDFSIVSQLVAEDGPKWKEQADFIKSTHAKGITEELVDTVLEKAEAISETEVKVVTLETFIIHGTEKTSEKKFRTVTLLEKNGEKYLVNELISTEGM